MPERAYPVHVIVAGAGLGGLALALALGRVGIDTTVVEQAEAFGEVGAGVQLSPNASQALFSLGIEPQVRAVGFTPSAAEVRDGRSQRLLLRNTLGTAAEARWGAPYLQVHRAALHGVLLDAVRREGRTAFRLGATVETVRDACAILQSGERVTGDVIVGCDGVRSRVAAALFGDGPARFTGQVAWRATVPTDRLPPGTVRPVAQVWTGPDRHFVCYPIDDGSLINIIAVTEETDWRIEAWSERGDKDALLQAFTDWPAPTRVLIAAADSVFRWALYDRPPRRQWSKGVATLLGDAAHPMLPFLAQGAGMAIEDAVVLARALSAGDPVETALVRYRQARHARTAKVQAWSRRNATLFHLPGPLAGAAFGAASVLDRATSGGGAARFDWLYGYDAQKAPL
jgi:salicylate hydroxylase